MGSPNPHRDPEKLRVDSLSETPDPLEYVEGLKNRVVQRFTHFRGQ